MLLYGKFTMISLESRTKDGRTYNNVNIEADDGKLLRIGVEEAVINKLQKYRRHEGYFEVGAFNNNMYMRLVDATPIAAEKTGNVGK